MIALLVHGGAGRIGPDRRDAYRRGLRAALDAGFARLDAGASALDAVEAAVATMEDDPHAFNAGTGSALTRDGTVECDAAVMTAGPTGAGPSSGDAGAVACVRTVRNPVRLARRVLEETPHVLLVGPGAEAWNARPIDPELLITDAARDGLRRWRERAAAAGSAHGGAGGEPRPEGSATCGAVAVDASGRLAAATSTGGVIGQWPGRVGDAPIPGAGTWADARVAISCTGRGEAFLRAATARALASDLAADAASATDGPSVEADRLAERVRARLAEVRAHDGEGGLIAVTRDGTLVAGFDTPQLAYGFRRRDRAAGGAPSDEVHVASEPTVRAVPAAKAEGR